ncbi:MAG: hypothetical protein GF399_05715 [Candidatus Coatesbacteria bacterium]|nr:hypothetical protein [Candidatus Coatesbacteria bacterium]
MVFEALNSYLAVDLTRVVERMGEIVTEGWAEETELLDGLAAIPGAESLGIRRTVRSLIEAGGKRLRAATALLAARGRGDAPAGEQAVELGAVVELLHLATLIHDDVIDRSALRRGTATLHTVVGEPVAVLAGDHLYSHALWDLLRLVPRLNIVRRLARTVDVLCRGEILQNRLARSGDAGWKPPDEDQYLQIIGRKTADFIAACGETGALLAEEPELVEPLSRYGYALGLAFQITDDLLDYTGASRRTGKEVGNDWELGRLTLPLIHALHDPTHHERLSVLLDRDDDDARAETMALLHRAGSLTYAQRRAADFVEQARDAVADYPNQRVAEVLRRTANDVLERRC